MKLFFNLIDPRTKNKFIHKSSRLKRERKFEIFLFPKKNHSIQIIVMAPKESKLVQRSQFFIFQTNLEYLILVKLLLSSILYCEGF